MLLPAGGYLAHSLAIMTDAAHLLTDFGSMMVSLFSLWISCRPPTKTMNYGWHRSEILGAFISVISIWIVTGALVYLAIERIVRNDYEIDGHVMLVTSGCAVIVNIIMAYILHHSTTFHSHGSGYQQIEEGGCSPAAHGHSHALLGGGHSNTSVRAAFIHVVGDLLQSVGVMVAAIIIYFRWQIPSVRSCSPSSSSSPPSPSSETSSGYSWKALLKASKEGADAQSVLQEATELLNTKFGFHSITIQVELHSEEMNHCCHCQDPQD
ncbi:hypothetical protein JOQ06_027772 [Pogonophryne albipinna]|uniref:Probable proton-coupled zinc antiporter SLC30A3 n=1 Tax=Pogonophryne albipinna TaxID=1090488 RepID=A0AAD6F4R1_9TELE|nr:hypothetical protein JOQ06_027772 [Pogonophryne albipinna]